MKLIQHFHVAAGCSRLQQVAAGCSRLQNAETRQTPGGSNGMKRISKHIESGTQLTSASGLQSRVYCYPTMDNHRVREMNLKKTDFLKLKQQVIVNETDRKNDD
jgi:hypothetical protein